MSNPKQNEFYIVEYGDNLKKISGRAYGYDRVYDIIKSNSSLLQPRIDSGKIHADLGGIPIVYKGDRLWIPPAESPEKENIEDDSEFEDNVTIRINGQNLKGFITNSIERSINSIADSFSFTAPYNHEDPESKLLDPFTYYPTEIFIAGELFMACVAESWNPTVTDTTSTMQITARTKAGSLIDCNSPDTRLNYLKKTIKQIADVLLQPFGIEFEIPYGDSGIINQAKRDPTEKIFDFLAKLAKQKGFILNSTVQGNIKLDRANINDTPILNLIQGDPNIISINPVYNGTERFSSFKALSQTRGNPKSSSEVTDTSISVNRPFIFSANNNEQGDIKNAALWERSRSLARSAGLNVTYADWRDKNKKIILENNTVTLYAPSACIFNETKYLIEKVSLDQSGGKTAILTLVLPQAYTLDFPGELPWQR